MSESLESLQSAISLLSKELKESLEPISNGFKKVDSNFDSIKKEIALLNAKLEILTKKVDQLKGTTNEGLESVGLKLENLTDEISKINTVTQYDDLFKNMKGLEN